MQVFSGRGETGGGDASQAGQQVGQNCELLTWSHRQRCEELLEYKAEAHPARFATPEDALGEHRRFRRHIRPEQRPVDD